MKGFLQAMHKTLLGQCLNLFSSNFGKKRNLNLFTIDRYSFIAQYKVSYYRYILPVTVAMYLVSAFYMSFLDMKRVICFNDKITINYNNVI